MTHDTAAGGLVKPRADGDILLYPDPAELLDVARGNFARLSSQGAPYIHGVSMRELRAAGARSIGHTPDRPLLMAGHQIELAHPGVWLKNVVIDRLAHRLGGQAWLLTVDTDAPKHLELRWPDGSAPLTDDPQALEAQWEGLVRRPSDEHLRKLGTTLADAGRGWGFETLMPEFFESMRTHAVAGDDLASQLAGSLHQLDRRLGLNYHRVMASTLWSSPAFLMVAHDILARAWSFSAAYNTALREYRDANGIKSDGRPWPDLAAGGDWCETPYWLDDLQTGSRRRAMVYRGRDGWELRVGADGFVLRQLSAGWDAAAKLGRFLSERQHRLSPRALTLSLFVRLALADLFVHGIGGAAYDQVTDRLITLWYAIEPPAIAVASATLYFPAAQGLERIDLRSVNQQERHLRHGRDDRAKRELVEQIAAAPRGSAERSELFTRMHAHLRTRMQTPGYQQAREALEAKRRQAQAQAALFDRDLFYLLQTRPRLEGLMSRVAEAFAE